MALNIATCRNPFPQDSRDSLSNSGNSPNFDGLKTADCERNSKAANTARGRLCKMIASATTNVIPSSADLVTIVTERLLKRSAKYPPGVEKRMNGTANMALIRMADWCRSRYRMLAPTNKTNTSVLRAYSLNALWKTVTPRANTRRHERGRTAPELFSLGID